MIDLDQTLRTHKNEYEVEISKQYDFSISDHAKSMLAAIDKAKEKETLDLADLARQSIIKYRDYMKNKTLNDTNIKFKGHRVPAVGETYFMNTDGHITERKFKGVTLDIRSNNIGQFKNFTFENCDIEIEHDGYISLLESRGCKFLNCLISYLLHSTTFRFFYTTMDK